MKRLFLFAGYDKTNFIDWTLIDYLKVLSNYGDIVFIMDNDVYEYDTGRLNEIPNLLHYECQRHGEYDFGSYKRAYMWAKKIIKNYDKVYFVNDSVFCLRHNLDSLFARLENIDKPVSGVFLAKNHNVSNTIVPEHVQSWFIGVNSEIANKNWFNKFFTSVTSQPNKEMVVWKYEIGFSKMLTENNIEFDGILSGEPCSSPSRNPEFLLKNDIAFVKKNGFGNISLSKIQKYSDKDLFKWIKSFVVHRHTKHSDKYEVIYEIRLFGFIPLLTKIHKLYSAKDKIMLFRTFPLYSIHK